MEIEKVNVREKLAGFKEHWVPKVLGQVNDCYVKVVKFMGPYNWHFHENEDEMFYVVQGEMTLKFRDKNVVLREGEFCVVPKGVEHMPVAETECHVLLFEPATTVNTGNTRNHSTILAENLEKI